MFFLSSYVILYDVNIAVRNGKRPVTFPPPFKIRE